MEPSNSSSCFADPESAASLSHRLSSVSLNSGNIVIIVALEKAAHYNFRAAHVLSPPATDGRIAVKLIHGVPKQLSVRRQNLLRASSPDDRAALLCRIALLKQMEMRVCRDFLLDKLQGEEGLLLEIAKFFPTRETMALTTGFAMGRIVPSWVCATLRGPARGLRWVPIHDGRAGWDGANVPIDGEQPVKDGIIRIDSAVVSIGAGQFLVAGGCADHPSRARAFFSSAFLYDSLTHVATALPDMPHPRHGCSGACLGGKVYVVGGDYIADGHPQRALCSTFDLATRRWSNDVNEPINSTFTPERGTVAFNPVAALDGRLVLLHEGRIHAFNPSHPELGWITCWRLGDADVRPLVGVSACAGIQWGRHFVVTTGRGGSAACEVMAFSFLFPPNATSLDDGAQAAPLWAAGQWAALGTTGPTGRVGCALAVVHDVLYVSGGVDEGSGGSFDGSVARWAGSSGDLPAAATIDERNDPDIVQSLRTAVVDCKRPWRRLNGLELPTAMHAHHSITIPWLPAAA